MSIAAPERASERLTRVMGMALGVGGLVFSALALPSMSEQYGAFARWWSVGVPVVVVGSLVALTALSLRASPRVLVITTRVVAVGYAASMALLGLAFTAQDIGEANRPWLTGLAIIATSAAAVGWSTRIAWGYFAAVIALVAVNQGVVFDSGRWNMVVQETLFDAFFSSLFVSLAIALRHAGIMLDQAAAAAADEVRRVATASARQSERTRIDALVHDSVLVALLASSAGSNLTQTGAAQHQAKRAMRSIESFAMAARVSQARSGVELSWELQAITTELDPEATFSYSVDNGTVPLPQSICVAVSEATAEALRNSVKHANLPDRIASRAIHVAVDAQALEVTVLDDGCGFDIDAVGPTRLGIAVSIVGRMRAEAGGDAIVVSRPGTGTRVSIRWARR